MNGVWEPTRDARLILDLFRERNLGIFEFAGQYSFLRVRDFVRPSFRTWLYRVAARPAGFAVEERTDAATIFQELWCDCDGLPRLGVEGAKLPDPVRRKETTAFLRAAVFGNSRPVLLRCPSDNPFGTLLARSSRWPLMNTLLLSTTKPKLIRHGRLPADYRIRLFRPGDDSGYSSIHNASFRERITPESFRRWASSSRCEAYSAIFRDKVIGFFIAELRRGGRLGDFDLAIDAAHRRRGVGTALMARGLRSFRRRGVATVIADHWATNAPAVEFYGKHGFRVARAYHFFRVR